MDKQQIPEGTYFMFVRDDRGTESIFERTTKIVAQILKPLIAI